MMVEPRYHGRPLAVELRSPVSPGSLELHWLGQAGFVLASHNRRVVIDPYLSDSLAVKYSGTTFEHERLMRPPIDVASLPRIDLVICTHGHSDHLDPWTVGPLAALQPDTVFAVPVAHLDRALQSGVPRSNLLGLDVGDSIVPFEGMRIDVVASAHEAIEFDANGHSMHLGVVIELDGNTLYHSGDCVPFPGQVLDVGARRPGLTLLPVNGRDRRRLTNGVPGNFHFSEAVELTEQLGATDMIAHHYGMFDFNTVDEDHLDRDIESTSKVSVVRAQLGFRYLVQNGSVVT